MSDADEQRRAELVAKLRALSKARGYKTSGELFRAYDGDGDGAIEAHELRALLTAADVGNGFTRPIYVSRIFERLDLDASEGLTLAELNGVLRELDPPPPPAKGKPAKPAEPLRTVPFVTSPPERPPEGGGGAAPWLMLLGLGWLLAAKGRR